MPTGPRVPSQAGSTTEIRIVNEISEIERVTDMVESFGACHKFSNSVIVALNVSLDEIINNIISYSYDDSGRHDIKVRLAIGSGGVEAIVEGDGKPFDPRSRRPVRGRKPRWAASDCTSFAA